MSAELDNNVSNSHLVVEEDDDEEEDVDFNPFLKESSSPEASSSLSSDEEGVGANTVYDDECSDKERSKKRKLVKDEAKEDEVLVEKNVVEDSNKGSDEEDAICRRTRARYSLANFSLDELENFLQETDDEEDLQNVDDEQEYRKFLAAVLLGGDKEGEEIQEIDNVDDEDEDSDGDFEIELEEALDSDVDENVEDEKDRENGVECRPKTRQNNRNKKLLGQSNKPLRHLVPLVPNVLVPRFPQPDCLRSLPNEFQHCTPSSQAGSVTGFTPDQIGQLHCLIHEHTQLLVQVFSLCVLDPCRLQIADETRRLILELVRKRDKVLSWRKVPYPNFCFRPPYIHPSVSDGLPKFQPMASSVGSSSFCRQKEVLNTMPVSHSGRCCDDGHVKSFQTINDSLWLPRIISPVLSVLDAAPLSLLKSYVADVSEVVQEHQKQQLEASYDRQLQKKPLFPLVHTPTSAEADSEALRGATSQGSSSLNVNQPPKKTLAASIIENTKKQSIAFAPKEIVSLAQRFYPFFNSALYPHKPPPAAAANRVHFTDPEDELLALGMMEYNTDWEAIQKRFLPCKSKHQIFIRQKNRCSSKAPENPIKAVRRMKTSPLTAEEQALIYKGLKVFRSDWMSVWKFLIPYRDPSLLSRQWRTAQGTQKSYKTDATKREKRRLYESQKRRGKAAASANCQTGPEKEDNLDKNADEGNKSENDNMEDEDEAYVHEAFLADWGPLRDVSHVTHVRYSASYTVASNNFCADSLCKSSERQLNLQPRQVPRRKDARLVKLAPSLPPVNLPPSVRVLSQSAFKSYQCAASQSTKISSNHAQTECLVPRSAHDAKSRPTASASSGNKGSTSFSQKTDSICPGDPRVSSNEFSTEDSIADTDPQMHPLLLQSPENGPLPYPLTNSNTCVSNIFNFMTENQLQANFNRLSKPSDAGPLGDDFYTSLSSKNSSKSCAIDFHPLLQRKDDGNLTQLRISCGSVIAEPHITSRLQTIAPMPASPNEMANELDLDIHLSSNRNKKSATGRKVTEHNYSGSRNDLPDVGIIKETGKSNKSSHGRSENCPTASVTASPSNQEQVLGNNKLVLSNDIARCTEVHVGDQSLPEIVMEQEELSDSEDESGEHVEFECEEMDDSEREKSDCE